MHVSLHCNQSRQRQQSSFQARKPNKVNRGEEKSGMLFHGMSLLPGLPLMPRRGQLVIPAYSV
jgi:hypothetical protein